MTGGGPLRPAAACGAGRADHLGVAGQLSGIPPRVANAGILVVVPPAIATIALTVLAALAPAGR